MSPELFNYKPYSYKSDVWSLGCVLYEICNLRHAFNAQTINGLAVKILKGNFAPVSPSYSKDLREIIHSMMAVDQKNRPSVKMLAQNPFVKRIITRYLIKLVREADAEDLDEGTVDSLRVQTQKLGLTEAIKTDGDADERVRQVLLGSRTEATKVDELKSLKMTKELELQSELERKNRLEAEMKNLREKKQKMETGRGGSDASAYEKSFKEDFLDNVKDSRSYLQSASQGSFPEKAEAEGEFGGAEADDYDDFEFVEEPEERSETAKDFIDSKIDQCEKRLARNSEMIGEIKSAINQVSQKIDSTITRKDRGAFEESFDEREFEEYFPNQSDQLPDAPCPAGLEEFNFAACLQEKILQAQK